MKKDWGYKVPCDKYAWGYDIKLTLRHKIRLFIGITGSMIKNEKEYYFYGVRNFHKGTYKFYYRIKHRILKKITPLLNKIL